jgi:hypothetical protein
MSLHRGFSMPGRPAVAAAGRGSAGPGSRSGAGWCGPRSGADGVSCSPDPLRCGGARPGSPGHRVVLGAAVSHCPRLPAILLASVSLCSPN